MRTAIVTDSTACLPAELVERYSIEVVPLHIIFGGRTFTDSLSGDTAEFYEMLRTSDDRPTTAAPSPGMFVEAIERAAKRADGVLCITVSKQFSAMYDAARAAAALARERTSALDVRVLDSRNAAMAQGFVVAAAAEVAEAGGSIDDASAAADAMASRVTLLAMLDTLTYLARGGRVPRVAAWAAGMLQLKPIVRFLASDIKLAARARTHDRALDRMAAIFEAQTAGRRVHVAVHHANAPADARRLGQRIEASSDCAELHVTEFTQVMGVHTGPGLVGIAFWAE